MAVAYTGLTIQFAGDTTKLQDALKTIRKESNNTNNDLKEINKSLKFNPGNTELLQQKVRNLNKAYEETKQRLDAYKQAMEQLEAKKQSGEQLTEQEQRQYESLQRAILQCENQLESYADAVKAASGEAEASKTKLYQMGQTLEDNADKLQKHGERMETAGKAMIGTSTAIVGASVAAFNEVDAGMDAVVKATGATGEAAEALGQSVTNVATTVAGSAYDWETLGNTVGEVSTRFGFTGQDLDDCSERFLQFASITGTDTVTAVQLVSRAMGDAGIDASEYAGVLDSLAAASQASGISVDKLAGLLTSYGAPMRALGFDTQSAIAIFSQWELAGVNTETAFSGMKKAISNWSAEGKDAKVEFGKVLEEIAACPDIASATTKSIEVFGAKAGPDLADAIQGGRFEYEKFMQILEGSEGTVTATFDETTDGVDQMNVAVKELQSAGAELGAEFSDMAGPVLHEFAGVVHNVAEAFKQLSPEQKEFAAKAVIMVGAAGGLTLGLGKLFQAAGNIGTGLKTVSTAWTTASTALSNIGGISGAWGALTSTVGGLATTIGTTLSGAWTAFTGLIAANPIGLGIAAVAAAVAGLTWFFTQTETGKQLWASFTGWISEKWQGIQTFLSGIPGWWSGVTTGIANWNETMRQNLSNTWEGMKTAAAEKWESIKAGASEKWNAIKANVSTTAENIRSGVTQKWESLKSSTAEKWEAIKSGTAEKWESIKSGVSGKVEAIKSAVSSGFQSAKDTALGIFESIKSGIVSKIQWAKDQISGIIDGIKGLFNFSWSLPRPSLPHINWHWNDIGGLLSIPVFDGISWYAKGNAVFGPNDPRIIGVGDNKHENEYLNTESQLESVVQNAMRKVLGAVGNVTVAVSVNANITGNASAYQIGQNIGRGVQSILKQQGASYA